MRRATVIVLDSVGIGAMPDADQYGDAGSATLQHIAEQAGLNVPNMAAMGLGNITSIKGIAPAKKPTASYGRLHELSPGKDTTTGHWELMGIVLEHPFPVYPNGFPKDWLDNFEKSIGRKTIGNIPASGTEIIDKLGEEHVKTGKPIVYTSADSVFQVAAHEECIPLKELYRICEIAREQLQPPKHGVARVIARPFNGMVGAFKRTTNRHDFSLPPSGPTVMNVLDQAGHTVYGVGKIFDIFIGSGCNKHVTTKGNDDGMAKTLTALDEMKNGGFLFVNLVDTDMLYGHRRDVVGYKNAIEAFDRWLPQFMAKMTDDDILILTSDHGCDPAFKGSDHTREYPFVLAWQPGKPGKDLGIRQGMCDVGATVAAHLGVKPPRGESLL